MQNNPASTRANGKIYPSGYRFFDWYCPGSRIASAHVCFGSQADICAATSHVRSTPDSDRESDFSQKRMSALTPKADVCSALVYVG